MAFDPAEQDQAYADLVEIFQQDIPAVALHPKVMTTVASRGILGFDTCPYRGDPTWCMDQLSLEEQEA
jgi:hypothetical protein